MFDWDDEELANTIWGDEGENEDHIVPYPDVTEGKPPTLYGEGSKRCDQEPSNMKLSEKKMPGFSSPPVMSMPDAAKSNLESKDEKAQVNDPQPFDSQPEDRDGHDSFDYSLANMGSFDELDKILSNDEPIFGNLNISGANALWLSTDCLEESVSLFIDPPRLQSGSLRSNFEHVETEAGFLQEENQPNPSDEMVSTRNKSLRGQKTAGEKDEAKQLMTSSSPSFSFGNKGSQYRGQNSQHIESSSPRVRNQRFESSQYKRSTNPLLPFKFSEGNHKVPSGSLDFLVRSPDAPSMTPQEKIEKLRRRQQLRAMLAIRKQQQQFRHQVSCNVGSMFPRCSNGSQTQLAEADNVEVDVNLSPLMSHDADSVVDQIYSDTIPMIDKSRIEDTILHQLEDVIARLDIHMRLCIRDSLFWLARSSVLRSFAGGAWSNNKTSTDEVNVVTEEELCSQKRMPEVETETNPIDHVIARLLFHTPLEIYGKLPESLKSTSDFLRSECMVPLLDGRDGSL